MRMLWFLFTGFMFVIAAAAQGAELPWPVRLRQDLDRIAQIEWRLRSAAGNACPANSADIGIVFDDRRAYDKRDWPLIDRVLGMRERTVVAAVAVGGPAELAGFMAGDEIEMIGGETVPDISARRNAGQLVADALIDEIAAYPQGASIEFVIWRDDAMLTLRVRPVTHCAARIVLVAKRGIDAYSDQRNAALTTGLVTFARNDDELAMAAGHELAHIINGDRRGAGISRRRAMEDAADDLGLRLLRCAGFDPGQALLLFHRLGKRDWLGFLNAPTHRSYGKRVERLQAQVSVAPAALQCPIMKE